MKSSVAPPPVMPKTATAVESPPAGMRKRKPSASSRQEKYSGRRIRSSAARNVSIVKSPTFTMARRSMRA